jgi:nicotinamidase-related amidase
MAYQISQIDPQTAALIVVDMQNDFVAAGAPMEKSAARAMVPTLKRALQFCRSVGIRVIYTTHSHRLDGCDMGLFSELYEPIAARLGLIDETGGIEIYPELAPLKTEHVIKKHRYSAFFGTDLDLILRGWGTQTVIVSGTTTEACCHATARDAMFFGYRVIFLADATATGDYPDLGFERMSGDEVHRATLIVLAASTAHVMTVDDMVERVPHDRRTGSISKT